MMALINDMKSENGHPGQPKLVVSNNSKADGLVFAEKNSIETFRKVVLDSKTILWNGPVGVFEFSNFSKGTKELGNLVAESTANGAFSLVGGGDSVAAVKKFGLQDKVSYVSTGGGAMLESLEGKILPGISALSN